MDLEPRNLVPKNFKIFILNSLNCQYKLPVQADSVQLQASGVSVAATFGFCSPFVAAVVVAAAAEVIVAVAVVADGMLAAVVEASVVWDPGVEGV